MTPVEFVAKWRDVTLKERASVQEHFIDLCRLLGHPTPAEDDPTGTRFTFEAGVTKSSGGQGFADVWKKGSFAWEYKGRHADLDRAYQQLLQYREALENPPLLVVSDIDRIIVHPNFVNRLNRPIEITLDDLLTPAGQQRLRDIFYAPENFRSEQTSEQVTEAAAAEFAHLADHLRKWGEEPQAIAHFSIRLLFCLFSEDINLLPANLFTRLVEAGRTRPDAFNAQLRQLFSAMATGGFFGEHDIRHFNGGLFDDASIIELDRDGLNILARIARLDWSAIEPSIFGTLFTRSLDPNQRAKLGAQYTSKEDILLIVEPVLMAPLRRDWAEVQRKAQELAARRDETVDRGTRTRRQNELQQLIMEFAHKIAAIRVLDPACGSGNFLYVSLKLLLDLEKEVINFCGGVGVQPFFPQVNPQQLYGIEINEYAHELAQATVWIGYVQWLRENGYGAPSEPILKPLGNIKRMDAILAWDENGKPYEPEWPETDVIVGNPPFLGNKRMRRELGDKYVDNLRVQYSDRVPGGADFVTYWFEIARLQVQTGKAQRVGLLATQSIRNGASRLVLDRIKSTGDIFYAQSDRPWILDGAAVRVSMVGFDDGAEVHKLLNESTTESARTALQNATSVRNINADLTGSLNVTNANQLSENTDLCFQGPIKVGPFDIDAHTADKMLEALPNINGRPNSDVVRPTTNASDIVRRTRNMWTVDFGTMTQEEASEYELPFEYIRKHVLPVRMQKTGDRYSIWWQYLRPRPELRKALDGLTRCIATPRVAKHRIFEWISVSSVPDTRLYVFARDDSYFLGVLHSHIHEVWSLLMAARHGVGNDPTYNNTTCFETFPFPWPPGLEPPEDSRVQAIAAAANELVEKRDAWLNPPGMNEAQLKKRTLTNLYNQRPTWLDLAHKRLDEAVLDTYGWPHDISDEEILERLLALNLERAARQGN